MYRVSFLSFLCIALLACNANTKPKVDTAASSDLDAIRKQFTACWNPAEDALPVRMMVTFEKDGTVIDAVLESFQTSRYENDSHFRRSADDVFRAIFKCSPLKNLPPEKYEIWKKMELNFDPSQML